MALGTVHAGMAFDADAFLKGMDASIGRLAKMKEMMDGMKPPEPSGFQKFMNTLTGLSSALNIGGAVASAAGQLKSLGAEAINAASAFNETSNVMQQAFGASTGAMEQWAAATADGLGRSTQAIRESVSVFQSMLEPMTGSADTAKVMSKSFTQLAVDLGSFWNVADSDAIQSLRAGISGETEPLKKFGIVMNEASLQAYALQKGIKAKVQEMTEAEKVQLRYNFIVDNTRKAHGDAARTADGYANSMKALQADLDKQATSLGQQILPAWQDLVVTFRDILRVFQGDDWTDVFTGIASGVKALADTFLTVAGAALTFLGTLKEISRQSAGSMLGIKLEDDSSISDLVGRVRALQEALQGGPANGQKPGQNNVVGTDVKNGKNGNGDKPDAGPRHAAAGVDFIYTGSNDLFKLAFDGMREAWKDMPGMAKAHADEVARTKKASQLDEIRALERGYQESQKNIAAANALRMKQTTDWLDVANAGSFGEMMTKGMKLAEPYIIDEVVSAAKKFAKEFPLLKGLDKVAGMFGTAGTDTLKGIMGDLGPKMAGMLKQAMPLITGALSMAGEAIGGAASYVTSALESAGKMIQSVVESTIGRFGSAAVSGNRELGSLGKGAQAGGGFVGANWGAFAGPWAMLTAPVVLAAGAFIGLTAGLVELSTQTKSYAQWQRALAESTRPLTQAMEPLWQQLLPLTSIFGQVNFALGQFLGILIPGPQIAQGLFYAVKWTSEGILKAAIEIGHIVNSLGGNIDTRLIAGSLHNLQDMTYQSAMAAASLQALSAAAGSAMNVPDVAKISYARYLSMRDENGAMSPDAAGLNRENDGGVTINVYGNATFSNLDEAAQAARDGHYRLGGGILSPRANLYQTG